MYLCLEHFNARYHLDIRKEEVFFSEQICKDCGEERPCVIMIDRPAFQEPHHQNALLLDFEEE